MASPASPGTAEVLNNLAALCERADYYANNEDACELSQCRALASRLRAIAKWIPRQIHAFSSEEMQIMLSTIEQQVLKLERALATKVPKDVDGYLDILQFRKQSGPGRPSIEIDAAWLHHAVMIQGLSLASIARALNISPDTVSANAQRLGLEPMRTRQSKWTEEDQRAMEQGIWDYVQEVPQAGLGFVIGNLRTKGILFTFDRVREYMQLLTAARLGSAGVETSFKNLQMELPRVYSVAGPNSLWHHDGQHGLVKHGIVIHAFIDGFSRHLTAIAAHTNNRAATVTALFKTAVQEYGFPSRVRGDRGGENVGVAAVMEEARGQGRGSYLWGK